MVVTTEVASGQLADLIKQVQAGNEVLLTQGEKPVARLVAAHDHETGNGVPLRIRSLAGHRVLPRVISRGELAGPA